VISTPVHLSPQSSVRHSSLLPTKVRKPHACQRAVSPRKDKQLTTSQRVAPTSPPTSRATRPDPSNDDPVLQAKPSQTKPNRPQATPLQNACLQLHLVDRRLHRQAAARQVLVHQHRRLQLLLYSVHRHVKALRARRQNDTI
jgi:hypothetical protein